ncbi:MAG: cytochrome c [Nitrospirae bacterium]|nr:MAG: cytochrome c [Nitrospirota bacterium]
MRKSLLIGIGTLAIGLAWCVWTAGSAEEGGGYGLGRTATDEEIRAWNIDVSPTGEGLPSGQGTVKQGAQVFAAKCAMCHGPTGTEGPKDRLVGGQGTLTTAKPVKTIGSYWPYATTLWDYIRRAMPFDHPGTLTSDEIYGVTAYVLFLNLIDRSDVASRSGGSRSGPRRKSVFGTGDAGEA